jgi:hypothetical protein
MFILRTIYPDSTSANTVIGEHYHYVGREENYEEFKETFKRTFLTDHVADCDPKSDNYSKNCYAFVITPNSVLPLYKKQHNYMMTSDGKTFANLTDK